MNILAFLYSDSMSDNGWEGEKATTDFVVPDA